MTSPLEVTLGLHERTRMGGLSCAFEPISMHLKATLFDRATEKEVACYANR